MLVNPAIFRRRRREDLGVGAPAPEGTQPDEIDDLFVWHKADGVLYQDSGRTTLATADADPVGSWSDESGNGIHLAQAGGNNRPKLKTNIVNGMEVVRFDYDVGTPADSDYFGYPDNTFDALTAAEAFVVIAVKNDPPAIQDRSGLWTIGGGGASAYPYTDNNIYEHFGSSAQHTVGNPGADLESFHLYNVITTATEFTASLDGTELFTTGTNTVAWATSPLRVGNNTALSSFLDGDIAELVIYSAKISAGDRTGIKAYFAAKYGLTIA